MIGYGHSADEFIAAILNMGMPYIPGCRVHAAPETIAKKCVMPSCDKLTRHNGGYCCADHCREHRAILRTSNTKPHRQEPAAGSQYGGGSGSALNHHQEK